MTAIEWGALDRDGRARHAVAMARSALSIDADRARSLVGADPEAALVVARSPGLDLPGAEWLARWSLARLRRGGRAPARSARNDGDVLAALLARGCWSWPHPLLADVAALATDPTVPSPVRLRAVDALFSLDRRPADLLLALVRSAGTGMEGAAVRAVLDAGATEDVRACYLTGEGAQVRVLRLAATGEVHGHPDLCERLRHAVPPHAERPLLWNLVRSAPSEAVRSLYQELCVRDPVEADALYPKLSPEQRAAIGPEGLAGLLTSDIAEFRERAFVRLGA